jgi:hypothetical protein
MVSIGVDQHNAEKAVLLVPQSPELKDSEIRTTLPIFVSKSTPSENSLLKGKNLPKTRVYGLSDQGTPIQCTTHRYPPPLSTNHLSAE